jgi:hypothetical protein
MPRKVPPAVRQYMSDIGSIVTRKKAEASRRNQLIGAEARRAPDDRLLKAAKAVSAGMSPTRAAVEVGKCRLSTLQRFLEKHHVPLKRYKKNAPAA